MSKAMISESILADIANAIRTKDGSTATMKPTEMAAKITAIPTGGGDEALKTLTHKTIESYSDDELKTLGNNTFENCKKLKSVDIPNTTSIGSSAFSGCAGLTEISLPQVTSIGQSTFEDCTGLTSVSLPLVEELCGGNFIGCSSLVSVYLSNCYRMTGSSHFHGCSSLMKIDLPAVTELEMGSAPFDGCESLEEIYLNSLSDLPAIYIFGYECMAKRIYLKSCVIIPREDYFRPLPNLEEIHFAKDNETMIKNQSGYASKFGATNATIYFDL